MQGGLLSDENLHKIFCTCPTIIENMSWTTTACKIGSIEEIWKKNNVGRHIKATNTRMANETLNNTTR